MATALRYAWTGRSPEGPASGEVDAPSADAVAELLIARGVTPLTIQPVRNRSIDGAWHDLLAPLWRWRQPRIQPVDQLLFSRQLHTLLRAGVPILRALAGLQESSSNPLMKRTLQAVRDSLESGIALSTSLARHPAVFNPFYVALVRVGEMTGRLDDVFLRLFHNQEFELFMRQQVKSALRYPIFVVSAMGVAVGVINLMVIPAFATVFEQAGAALPLPTRLLMASSRFTLDWGWALGLGAVAGFVLLHRWRATPKGRLQWDAALLRIPIAGKIIAKAMLARFARSFALSLKSGVPIEQALVVVTQTVDNHHIARRIEGMRTSVERGDSILRAAVAADVFTPVVLQMIAVGEETGAIDELMDEVAELYTNEVQYELKTLAQQLEPILIVFLGVLVLILALGVFLPVWDLGRTALHPN